MSKKYYPLNVRALAWVIRLLLGVHSHGIEILHGVHPFPCALELAMIIEFAFDTSSKREAVKADFQAFSIDVNGGSDTFAAEIAAAITKIITDSGGSARIAETFQKASAEGCVDYRITIDTFTYISRYRPSAESAPVMPRLAVKYGKHVDTLRRRRDSFILEIADRVINGSFESFGERVS